MFEHDFAGSKDFRLKIDKQASFSQFLQAVGLSLAQYPYTLDGLVTYKGKRPKFTASGWGGYFNADGAWTLFIAYRCVEPEHTIQHTWAWDAENSECFNHRVFEFTG
jgi:hypothetical protein